MRIEPVKVVPLAHIARLRGRWFLLGIAAGVALLALVMIAAPSVAMSASGRL